MKTTPWFTHPQAILGVYDFLLSDESNQSYIKNILALPRFQDKFLYNGSEWGWMDEVQ